MIENRKARHDYFIEDTIECGMVLCGNEVKSIREGAASIKEAWVDLCERGLVVKQMHITPWKTSNIYDINKGREIRLLAHKSEIGKLKNKVSIKGYTLVPLKIYFNNKGLCKMLVGICKGKHDYDKRAVQKKRDAEREMRRFRG